MFRNTDVHYSTGKLSLTVGNPSKTSENLDLFDNDFSVDETDPLSIAIGDQAGHGQLCVPRSLKKTSGENFWPLCKRRTKDSLAQGSDSTEDSNCRLQPKQAAPESF